MRFVIIKKNTFNGKKISAMHCPLFSALQKTPGALKPNHEYVKPPTNTRVFAAYRLGRGTEHPNPTLSTFVPCTVGLNSRPLQRSPLNIRYRRLGPKVPRKKVQSFSNELQTISSIYNVWIGSVVRIAVEGCRRRWCREETELNIRVCSTTILIFFSYSLSPREILPSIIKGNVFC